MSSILLLDNDPVFGAVLEDRLQVEGHDVDLVRDRDAALEMARTNDYDLAILEIETAQESRSGDEGLATLTALRQESGTRALPILVLSEGTESTDRVAALRGGADDYLTKPCDLDELLLRAERLFDSRSGQVPVLQGDLFNYPLWELMQYLQQAGKSGQLVLRGETDHGRIWLSQGLIVAARWEHLPGAEALLAVFGMKRGHFRFVPEDDSAASPPEATRIDAEGISVHEVLMEAAWLEDELGKLRDSVPGTGMPLTSTDRPLPEPEEGSILVNLPVADLHAHIAERSEARLYDLVRELSIAPQKVRLIVAWLMEKGLLEPPGNHLSSFPTTHEIASSELLDIAIDEFLAAARRAGFGTSALPFLIVVAPSRLPAVLELVENVPGYRRNAALRGFADQLREGRSGSLALPSELGKLWLHVHPLEDNRKAQIEAAVTVSAGVLLWLDDDADEALARGVIDRLDKVKTSARGVAVATHAKPRALADRLTRDRQRWRASSHAPRSLLGAFRLLQPVG